MEYIYKYTDMSDGIVKYVGITKDLNKRIYQHKRDKLGAIQSWKIEYAEYPTRADVEFLEGHLIALYGTAAYFNIAKSGFGKCSFDLDEIPWKEYAPAVEREKRIISETDTVPDWFGGYWHWKSIHLPISCVVYLGFGEKNSQQEEFEHADILRINTLDCITDVKSEVCGMCRIKNIVVETYSKQIITVDPMAVFRSLEGFIRWMEEADVINSYMLSKHPDLFTD